MKNIRDLNTEMEEYICCPSRNTVNDGFFILLRFRVMLATVGIMVQHILVQQIINLYLHGVEILIQADMA